MSDNAAQAPTLDELTAKVSALEAERDSLRRQLAGQKGQVTKARAALAATLPGKPRKFAAIEPLLAPGDLLELIDNADAVELAFVGPKGLELADVAPRTIEGGARAWRLAVNGLRLEVPSLTLILPDQGKPPLELAGYVLLLDGEAAATAQRMDVLRLAGGTRHELKDDVVF